MTNYRVMLVRFKGYLGAYIPIQRDPSFVAQDDGKEFPLIESTINTCIKWEKDPDTHGTYYVPNDYKKRGPIMNYRSYSLTTRRLAQPRLPPWQSCLTELIKAWHLLRKDDL